MRLPFVLPWVTGCQLVFPLQEDLDATGSANIAFITSNQVTGALEGLAGADRICQDAAEAGELPPNTYIAWLSDSETNAIDRLRGARGWVRPDNQPVADSPSELGIKGPRVPIAQTEFGDDVRALANVWTGTLGDGTKDVPTMNDRTCADWTDPGGDGRFGDPELGAGQFTASGNDSCGESKRLYCFGIDLANELEPAEPAGPLWFVSSTMWNGMDADVADDLCSTEAGAAELVGSFRAVITRDGELISDRFEPTSNFYRVDGVLLGQLLIGDVPNTFPFLTAGKTIAAGTNEVWTGGLTRGTAATTCSNWSGSGTGTSGFRHVATANMFVETAELPCDHDAFVYCAQDN